jgi:hypothetical protein
VGIAWKDESEQSGTLYCTHYTAHTKMEASTWMGDHQGRPPATAIHQLSD